MFAFPDERLCNDFHSEIINKGDRKLATVFLEKHYNPNEFKQLEILSHTKIKSRCFHRQANAH